MNLDPDPVNFDLCIAAGEAGDLLDALDTQTARKIRLCEIDHLAAFRPESRPTVLVLSRALATPAAPELLSALPRHVIILTTDPGAVRIAERSGRPFIDSRDLSMPKGLARTLRAALRESRDLLA